MSDILYSKTHESVYENNGIYVIGIGYPGIKRLGKITGIKLPSSGNFYTKGEIFGYIEAEKSAEELYMPVGGMVIEVYDRIIENPSLFNDTGYNSMPLFRIVSESFPLDSEDLLPENDYLKLSVN